MKHQIAIGVAYYSNLIQRLNLSVALVCCYLMLFLLTFPVGAGSAETTLSSAFVGYRDDPEGEIEEQTEEEIEEEVEEEIEEELEEEVSEEIEDQIEEEVEEAFEEELEEEAAEELEEALEEELEEELEAQLEDDLARTLEEETEEAFEEDLEAQLEEELEEGVADELEDQLQEELEQAFEEDAEAEFEQDMQDALERELEEDMGEDMEEAMAQDMEDELSEELEEQLEGEVEFALEEETEQEFQEVFEREATEAFEQQLQEELQEELQGDLELNLEEDSEAQFDEQLQEEFGADIEEQLGDTFQEGFEDENFEEERFEEEGLEGEDFGGDDFEGEGFEGESFEEEGFEEESLEEEESFDQALDEEPEEGMEDQLEEDMMLRLEREATEEQDEGEGEDEEAEEEEFDPDPENWPENEPDDEDFNAELEEDEAAEQERIEEEGFEQHNEEVAEHAFPEQPHYDGASPEHEVGDFNPDTNHAENLGEGEQPEPESEGADSHPDADESHNFDFEPGQEPSAYGEPSAGEEPSAFKEPSAGEAQQPAEHWLAMRDEQAMDDTELQQQWAMDDLGNPVLTKEWVILVDDAAKEGLEAEGYSLLQAQYLATFDRYLARLQAPASFDLQQDYLALQQRLNRQGVLADFNHLYAAAETSESAPAGATSGSRNTAIEAIYPQQVLQLQVPASLRIGMIDTAVATDLPVFKEAKIQQQNFVAADVMSKHSLPKDHGTSVAAILVGQQADFKGVMPSAELLAASVFAQQADGRQFAATESIVSALNWLVENNVKVINMSLAGPPNQLLQFAIDNLCLKQVKIVAAVGNAGPLSKPLYPAAYECAVAVTAVDERQRVYKHAVRGKHVDLAAYGVNVATVDLNSRLTQATGTSMATPFVTAYIASKGVPKLSALNALFNRCEDLGKQGYDSTYGHGLLPTGVADSSQ